MVVAGHLDADDTQALIAALNRAYLPETVVLLRDPEEADAEALARLAPYAAGLDMHDGKATAYVCRDFACGLPVTDPQAMLDKLKS